MSNARNLSRVATLIASGSPLGFRNILINGDFRVNQRGFNGTWTGLSNGDYGFDRWKRSNSDIQQVVEAGNFIPDAVHTISGTNVTTAQITAPSSGDWTITVPNNATNIQLELGTVATPFERRPIALELRLCERYYRTVGSGITTFVLSSGASVRGGVTFDEMYAAPTITLLTTTPTIFVGGSGVQASGATATTGSITKRGFRITSLGGYSGLSSGAIAIIQTENVFGLEAEL
jgi:hypothetical protein